MYTNKDIRKAIVYSYIKKIQRHFIPYLLSKNVHVDYWNKTKFYKLNKYHVLKLKVVNQIREIRFEPNVSEFYSNEFL